MKVIGITGGVGAGKSTVMDILKELCDCVIIKADDVAKSTIIPGGPAYKKIVCLLGKDILSDDGYIDRLKMSEIIFSDKNLCEQVNNIIHPVAKQLIIDEIKRQPQSREAVFVEAALLIESGYTDLCDEVWYIHAPKDIRFNRLIKSRGYSVEKCESIIANQLSEEEFRKHSDVVIDNSNEYGNVKKQLEELMHHIYTK